MLIKIGKKILGRTIDYAGEHTLRILKIKLKKLGMEMIKSIGTTENESANEGYKFGQEEETYNIVAAHGYFGRLIFQYASLLFVIKWMV